MYFARPSCIAGKFWTKSRIFLHIWIHMTDLQSLEGSTNRSVSFDVELEDVLFLSVLLIPLVGLDDDDREMKSDYSFCV